MMTAVGSRVKETNPDVIGGDKKGERCGSSTTSSDATNPLRQFPATGTTETEGKSDTELARMAPDLGIVRDSRWIEQSKRDAAYCHVRKVRWAGRPEVVQCITICQ